MSRRDFWKIVVFSSLLSAALVLVFLRWPSPPVIQAESPSTPPPVVAAADRPLTEEESINIDVYKELSQAVVNITSTTIEYTWFFEAIPRQGVGSGFLIDSKGHIVTNFHVIEDAKRLEVTLFDESVLDAEVIGQDPINDLAVIKIECPDQGCRPVRLGRSDALRVGRKCWPLETLLVCSEP